MFPMACTSASVLGGVLRDLIDFDARDLWIAPFWLGPMVLLGWWAGTHGRARRELRPVAAGLGLSYQPRTHATRMRRYHELYPFGGDVLPGRVANVVSGRRGGVVWVACDLFTAERRLWARTTQSFGIVVAADLPIDFRPLHVRPREWPSLAPRFAGEADLRFESEPFNLRYRVAAADRRQAFDVLNPRVLSHLLDLPLYDWQFSGAVVLVHRSGVFAPDELPRVVGWVEGLLARIPDYLPADSRGANA